MKRATVPLGEVLEFHWVTVPSAIVWKEHSTSDLRALWVLQTKAQTKASLMSFPMKCLYSHSFGCTVISIITITIATICGRNCLTSEIIMGAKRLHSKEQHFNSKNKCTELIFVTSYFQTISLEKGNKWFVLLTVQFQELDVFFFRSKK